MYAEYKKTFNSKIKLLVSKHKVMKHNWVKVTRALRECIPLARHAIITKWENLDYLFVSR